MFFLMSNICIYILRGGGYCEDAHFNFVPIATREYELFEQFLVGNETSWCKSIRFDGGRVCAMFRSWTPHDDDGWPRLKQLGVVLHKKEKKKH